MAAAVLTARLAPVPRFSARQILAALAGLTAVGHLLVLFLLPHSIAWSVVLIAMTLWCMKCAWCVGRGGAVMELLLMCAAMGAAHIVMVVGMPWFNGHHGGHTTHSVAHAGIMLLIAGVEFSLMFASAVVIRRQADR